MAVPTPTCRQKIIGISKRRSTKCSPDKRGEVTYLLVGPNIEKEDLKEKNGW